LGTRHIKQGSNNQDLAAALFIPNNLDVIFHCKLIQLLTTPPHHPHPPLSYTNIYPFSHEIYNFGQGLPAHTYTFCGIILICGGQ
jgi:hypothetical protein